MCLDEKIPGNKKPRDRSLIRLLRSPGILLSASGVSSFHKNKKFSKNKVFFPSDPKELCERLNFLVPEKHAGKNCDIIDE